MERGAILVKDTSYQTTSIKMGMQEKKRQTRKRIIIDKVEFEIEGEQAWVPHCPQ